jgi:hypothetical protein
MDRDNVKRQLNRVRAACDALEKHVDSAGTGGHFNEEQHAQSEVLLADLGMIGSDATRELGNALGIKGKGAEEEKPPVPITSLPPAEEIKQAVTTPDIKKEGESQQAGDQQQS